MGIVERFIDRLDAQDWAGFAEALADDGFERIGPFGEVTPSKASYVEFLAQAVPHLADYRVTTKRVVYAGNVALAELVETFVLNDKPVELAEAWVFDIRDDGRIGRVAIYQTWPEALTEAAARGGAGPAG